MSPERHVLPEPLHQPGVMMIRTLVAGVVAASAVWMVPVAYADPICCALARGCASTGYPPCGYTVPAPLGGSYLPQEYKGPYATAYSDGTCQPGEACIPPCNLYNGPGDAGGRFPNPNAGNPNGGNGIPCSDTGTPLGQ
jgi:hypothetical protein